MHVVELAFTATPERLAARPAHRALLDRLHDEGRLLAAGPWADDTGALLVFTTDRADLDAILAADPYYRTPGVQVISVREWTPVAGPPPHPSTGTAG
ncbi:hypothetical protein Sru01_25880 [Sphaerisporangium rufum]|uniref:YCII-related domain-containing protein n=1 Tax=Sphaerisporangium rufum TaxID=1381558 RepID=A0A919UY25_9ACTN|nr:YciI family protein [Sphaerisporangium rufum]GII77606.1 hypothetical protein Sru01_25880 [Sphaerisporangium rufum]